MTLADLKAAILAATTRAYHYTAPLTQIFPLLCMGRGHAVR